MLEVGLGDTPMRLAKKRTGNPYRYGELLAANPHKSLVYVNGMPTFKSLGLGERLALPSGWLGFVDATTYSGRLMPGQRLAAGHNLWSKNKRGLLLFETNGNLSWWAATPDANGNAIQNPPPWNMWQAWITGKGGVSLLMQTDGNLVVLDRNNNPVWSTGTPGHPGGFLIAGDDGQLALADADGLYWALGTEGWKKPSGTPWYRGKRSDLDRAVSTAEDIGSYATAVISFVPGVGTGVSAALAAGIALAQGESITDAVKNGIRDAIPGGAIATAGFDMATKLASGENIEQATLETARNQLPPDGQKAFDIGLAVVTGAKHQQANPAIVAPSGQGHAAIARAIASVAAAQPASPVRMPPKTLEPPKRAIAVAPAPPTRTPPRTLEPPKRVAVASPAPIATSLAAGRYAPYPKMGTAGLGSFWSSNAWRWFAVYENGVPTTQRGPLWLSDNDANIQAANLLASTQGKDAIGDVARWDWDGSQWHQTSGALGDTATEVRSPTSTSTEVRSPTSTSTEVRSPTSTSTEAYTQGNMTVTVTGGAGAGATHVTIEAPPLNKENVANSKGAPKNAQENTNVNAPRPKNPTAQENSSVNAPRSGVGGCFNMDEVTWGPSITGMSGDMRRAGLSAVQGSRGRPRVVRGPDGTDYLFAIEGGALTARPAIQ